MISLSGKNNILLIHATALACKNNNIVFATQNKLYTFGPPCHILDTYIFTITAEIHWLIFIFNKQTDSLMNL